MSLTPNNNKSLLNLFELTVDEIMKALNCIKIGVIQSFDPSKQTVSVKILHKKTNETNIDTRELEDYSLLPEVPVVIIGGGGSYISFPIKEGDTCLILFNDFELDNWWVSGESLPSDFPRRHDLSDGIAIVGLNNLTKLIQSYSEFLNLHYSDNSSIIIGNNIDINNGQTNVNGNLTVSGAIVGKTTTTSELHDTRGVSGTFTDTGVGASGLKLTITDGIITGIG